MAQETSPAPLRASAAPHSDAGSWWKASLATVLLAISAGLTLWFHFRGGTEVGYTHLFYLPIVLAGMWWGLAGGVAVAVLLGTLLVGTHLASQVVEPVTVDLFRALMLLVMGAVVGALRDRHRKAEVQVERHAAELEGLNRRLAASEADLRELNAAKDRFFSIISHDLRSPFAPLLQYADSLVQEAAAIPRDKLAEYAQVILNTTRRFYALIENLLDWSRLQTGKFNHHPCTVDLAPVVDGCLGLLGEAAAGKRVRLKNDVDPGTTCTADRNHLERIVQNLVSNGIKFTPAGGEVRIKAGRSDGRVELSVSDTGVGMPPEFVARLFHIEECRSTPGTAHERGSGLGLLLCHDLAAINGGKISVASNPGRGSTFTVNLPA